jgi:hypothetical protein
MQERSDSRLCSATLAAWQQRTLREAVTARKLCVHLAKVR